MKQYNLRVNMKNPFYCQVFDKIITNAVNLFTNQFEEPLNQ